MTSVTDSDDPFVCAMPILIADTDAMITSGHGAGFGRSAGLAPRYAREGTPESAKASYMEGGEKGDAHQWLPGQNAEEAMGEPSMLESVVAPSGRVLNT